MLCANSATGKRLAQLLWRTSVKALRYCSNSWLTRSVCPSVWGWYAVEVDPLMPSRSNIAFRNLDTNCGPRSLITCFGVPWCFQTKFKNRSAVSGASTVLCVGARCTIFVRRSTVTKIAS